MRVEACCEALLRQLLPILDPQQEGLCFDVGVGTFALYCELFAKLGFTTIAVEPLPTDRLRAVCNRNSIQLIEQCLSSDTGQQTLHIGQFAGLENTNFSSLDPDWFGSSKNTIKVNTMDLNGLLRTVGEHPITCLKLDIEGWEPFVIAQLEKINQAQLPKLVMFEYGGGGYRHQYKKGWSEKFSSGTLRCLRTLQDLGYGHSIMVDYADGSRVKLFDLQCIDLSSETPFYRNSVYGNILTFLEYRLNSVDVDSICAPYQKGLIHSLVGKLLAGM
ncbi:FkbM family methyltransferase [Halomicronema sp. CCY15110]|uniref:FkbM family methyltransferase n=1 Tax=Halomicronema sp. CCY15110 TaxID=2767773 RepID=UPI00194E7A24|nr:FkbM family methyltransferase [Halomicronema sp. CCY15110]